MSASPLPADPPRRQPLETLEIDVSSAEGPWTFTREQVIEPARADAFYALYALAFDPLKTRAVARQVLTRAEFHDQMNDRRIDKYIAWDTDGEAVGITTLTRHLAAVPWISPEYFAAHYPEQWARNAIYYLGFTLAHPRLRQQRFLETIIGLGIGALSAQQAVIAYDVCAYNNSALRFTERIEDLLRRYPQASFAAIDSQVYYAVSFT
jgi:hypothetical protein